MFGRFPGEEQGEAVKDVLRTNNPSKRMADPFFPYSDFRIPYSTENIPCSAKFIPCSDS
jgi:hypothetical protein